MLSNLTSFLMLWLNFLTPDYSQPCKSRGRITSAVCRGTQQEDVKNKTSWFSWLSSVVFKMLKKDETKVQKICRHRWDKSILAALVNGIIYAISYCLVFLVIPVRNLIKDTGCKMEHWDVRNGNAVSPAWVVPPAVLCSFDALLQNKMNYQGREMWSVI